MARQRIDDGSGAFGGVIAKPSTVQPTPIATMAAPAQMSQPWQNVQTPYAAPSNSNYAPTVGRGGGGPGGIQGGAGVAGSAAAAAAPKINYGGADYLNGSKDGELDGTFHDQSAMYSAKLKRYIADYNAQAGDKAWGKDAKDFNLGELGGSMGIDYKNANEGIARNRTLGLTGLSEDFANRGMTNSGLYARDLGQSQDQYARQGTNLNQGVHNQLQTLNFNRGNQETDNQAQIASARRDALNRLSQAQSLT